MRDLNIMGKIWHKNVIRRADAWTGQRVDSGRNPQIVISADRISKLSSCWSILAARPCHGPTTSTWYA